MAEVDIVAPGPLSLPVGLGRPGYAHLGVPAGGAFDRAALRLANRLVGNDEAAVGIETLFGGLAFRADRDLLAAVSGAPAAVAAGGRPVAWGAAVFVPAGQELSVGNTDRGARTYVAIRGGVVPPRSWRPTPLRAGDRLIVRNVAQPPPGVDLPPLPDLRPPRLRVVPGPRDDWFAPAALDALMSSAWRVTQFADRTGLRLSGPVLTRRIERELASEGVVRGAIQVPPDGQPIVFGPDHPTTGGYPVIACVLDADTDLLAQARPGDEVRFRRA